MSTRPEQGMSVIGYNHHMKIITWLSFSISALYLLAFLPLYLSEFISDYNPLVERVVTILFQTSFLFPIAWTIVLLTVRRLGPYTFATKLTFAVSGTCIWVPASFIAIGGAFSPPNSGFGDFVILLLPLYLIAVPIFLVSLTALAVLEFNSTGSSA
jgi:hypothetical protein